VRPPFPPRRPSDLAAMLVGGAIDAIVDVSQNAHGLRVQRLYGRSILNAFHAAWSAGAVLGGLMGSAAAGADLDLGVHLGLSGALFCVVALVANRFMLPGPEGAGRDRPSVAGSVASADGAARPSRAIPARTLGILLALGVLGACAALTEDAGSSWGAIYLTGSLGAAAG